MAKFPSTLILKLVYLAIGFLILPIASASGEPLKIGGTGSALGVMKLLGSAFRKENSDVELTILPSLGSGGGIKALNAGVINLALSSRPLKPKEKNYGFQTTPYGSSALVFAGNPVVAGPDLTTARLLEIYGSGNAQWPDGSRIRLILRPEAESDTKLLKAHIHGMKTAMAMARSVPGVPVMTTDQETASALEHLRGSLGTAALGLILSEKRSLKVFSLNGVTANATTIRAGTYPIVKTYYFITATVAPEIVRRFLAFVRSQDGRKILEEHGHVAHFGKALR